MKHSSSTSRQPLSVQRRAMRSSKPRPMHTPEGLFGWLRNTTSVSGVIASRMPSSSRNAASSGQRVTAQSTDESAASYSVNDGAVTSARRGRRACATRKIRSAAPLPQRICSIGTPSCRAMAARSARHSGSG